MARETIAAALVVWLIGAVVGWCAGWAGRGEQNRRWHQGVVARLTLVRAELAQALNELDTARVRAEAARAASSAPAVVHVHVAGPLPWAAPQPLVTETGQFLDELPVLSAREVGP